MDRQIILAKPKYKIRHGVTGKLRSYYIEMSSLRTKVYFTIVDLQHDKQILRGSPNRLASAVGETSWNPGTSMIQNDGVNIEHSSGTSVISVWKKQVERLFMQIYDVKLQQA